jgi:quinol-cytochrome oxidoreductase complex cytochrome b subunit
MSFWAAMVITSLLASIPVIGTDLILLLWGDILWVVLVCKGFILYILHYLSLF